MCGGGKMECTPEKASTLIGEHIRYSGDVVEVHSGAMVELGTSESNSGARVMRKADFLRSRRRRHHTTARPLQHFQPLPRILGQPSLSSHPLSIPLLSPNPVPTSLIPLLLSLRQHHLDLYPR